MNAKQAKERIGMVVEGAYTAVSALQLSEQLHISMPISEAVQRNHLSKFKTDRNGRLRHLMKRDIKEEHL